MPSEYRWYRLDDGRSVYRKVPEQVPSNRSSLPCPLLIRDEMDRPLMSMADGQTYTSKSAMRASYLPSGNPQGKRYVEVGNEYEKPYKKPEPKIDAKAIDASLHKAVARYERGERVKM